MLAGQRVAVKKVFAQMAEGRLYEFNHKLR